MLSCIVRCMPASLLLPLPLLTLAACGPKVTNQNIDALNTQFEQAERSGRTVGIKEVESILGPPLRVESFPIEMRTVKVLPGQRYYYEQDGQTVELHFIDNKLIRRVLRFGEEPPEEKDRPGFKTPLRPLAEEESAAPTKQALPDELPSDLPTKPESSKASPPLEQPAPALPDEQPINPLPPDPPK